MQALHRRWIPCAKADLPFSVHTSKNGATVRRYLGDGFLKEYGWLAVSKIESMEGAWCTFCSVFQSSECGGGRGASGGIGGSQKMGALVNRPTRYSRR